MNKIGSAGDFWIMPFLNRPVSLGLNQLIIRLKNLNTKYLYYYLSTNYGKAMINASINGAVTKSITKSAVKALPLLYPNLELQNKFSELINLIEKQKNKSTTTNANNLFQTLIQKAFKGELVQ
jgi:type I restriction enzyme S subunit